MENICLDDIKGKLMDAILIKMESYKSQNMFHFVSLSYEATYLYKLYVI